MGRCVPRVVLGGERICLEKEKEYREKNRIIDRSATRKFECYVNVCLKKPTQKNLFAEVPGKLRCDGEKIRIEKEKDYHEKDGSIDGKVECYVHVFLKKPTEKVGGLSLT